MKNTCKTPFQKVQMSRDINRKKPKDFVEEIFKHYTQLHGDRATGDDKTISGGIGLLDNKPVTVIFQNRGKNLKENLLYNYGMASPSGYRKAMRLMKQAEKFQRPIICFVDTPGAACDMESENFGQASVIANSIRTMITLSVPTITIITSEGGSGGALGLSSSDKLFMLENAVFSVISPEGYSAIVWKDSSKANLAANELKLTAQDLYERELIDGIISEMGDGLEANFSGVCENIKKTLVSNIRELSKLDKSKLLKNRYKKYYSFGEYL